MHQSLENVLPKIEEWLSRNEIEYFKIGFTTDICRREKEYSDEAQKDIHLYTIATGNENIIREAEKDFIIHFKTCNKCLNNQSMGGTGNTANLNKECSLYIAIWFEEKEFRKDSDLQIINIMFQDIKLIKL